MLRLAKRGVLLDGGILFSFSGPATQQPEEVRTENLSTEVFDLAGTSLFPKPPPTGLSQGPVKETLESALIALDSEK